jgi:hypothetical protein
MSSRRIYAKGLLEALSSFWWVKRDAAMLVCHLQVMCVKARADVSDRKNKGFTCPGRSETKQTQRR